MPRQKRRLSHLTRNQEQPQKLAEMAGRARGMGATAPNQYSLRHVACATANRAGRTITPGRTIMLGSRYGLRPDPQNTILIALHGGCLMASASQAEAYEAVSPRSWWAQVLPVAVGLGGFGLYATYRAFE